MVRTVTVCGSKPAKTEAGITMTLIRGTG
jgi:hypothetical protein